MATKTDNHNLELKLRIRRQLLDQYGCSVVFDACRGSGEIWGRLRKEYECRYQGVDVKPMRGRVSIRSERLLALPGWTYDVIDIDTYGSPWRHWSAMLPNVQRDCTVFLTIGRLNISNTPKEIKGTMGLPKSTPLGIMVKLWDLGAQYLLAQAGQHDIIIDRAISARSGNVQYIGLRLKKAPVGAGA